MLPSDRRATVLPTWTFLNVWGLEAGSSLPRALAEDGVLQGTPYSTRNWVGGEGSWSAFHPYAPSAPLDFLVGPVSPPGWFLAPCIAAEALRAGARCTVVQGPVGLVGIPGRRGQARALGEAEGAGVRAPAHGGCSASAQRSERGARRTGLLWA